MALRSLLVLFYVLGMCQRKTKAISGMGKKLLYVGLAGLQSAFENKGFLQHFCPHKSAKRKNGLEIKCSSIKQYGAVRPIPAASSETGYFQST